MDITTLLLLSSFKVYGLYARIQTDNALSSGSVNTVVFHQQRLLSNLYANYSKNVIPHIVNQTIQVDIGFNLRNILFLEGRTETLTTCFWLDVIWEDFRLEWDSSEYGGVKQVYASRADAWVPDLVVDNTASSIAVLGRENDILVISNDGTVRWTPGEVVRTRCRLKNTYFPFDEQDCQIVFVCWTYKVNQVKFKGENHTLSDAHLTWKEHGEWQVRGIDVDQAEEYAHVPTLTVHLRLRRRSEFYVFNIILPLAMTAFLNAFLFLLPAESGEKVNLATALFLSYAVFLSFIVDNMPTTSTTVSILGVFVSVQLVLSALSILSTVCLLKHHHRRRQGKDENGGLATSEDGRSWDAVFFTLFSFLGGATAFIVCVIFMLEPI